MCALKIICPQDILLPVFLNRNGFDLIIHEDKSPDQVEEEFSLQLLTKSKDKNGFWALRG